MKLYVWRGPDVLRNYSSGIAFALAPSLETARALIRGEYEADYLAPTGYKDQDWVNDDLAFLDKDPRGLHDSRRFLQARRRVTVNARIAREII